MNKKIIIMVVIIVVLILSAIIFIRFSSEDIWICQNGQWVKHGNPSAPEPEGNCGVNQNQNTNTGEVLNKNINKSEANIIVDSPKPGEKVSLPLKISGQARVFENQFNYRLKNKDGFLITAGSIMASSLEAGKFGPFSVDVNYTKQESSSGTLEVFDFSAKDGTETDKVIIPVKF